LEVKITMSDDMTQERKRHILDRTRQLILMRETGPKSRAWHAARVRLIWRLHDELRGMAVEDGDRTATEGAEGTAGDEAA
jgi:hypothetical protein